jgi:hypothetical protein
LPIRALSDWNAPHGWTQPPPEDEAKARPIDPNPPRLAEFEANAAAELGFEVDADDPKPLDPELDEKNEE